jgi:hypothetical protein
VDTNFISTLLIALWDLTAYIYCENFRSHKGLCWNSRTVTLKHKK